MRNALASSLAGLSLVAFYGGAVAQGLPKSGSISWHTGWRMVGEALEVAKGRVEGHGSVIGTSFNEKAPVLSTAAQRNASTRSSRWTV